jgi:formyltetrahydrofolate-dependent phosphoribosylglycinamide formyltransferase
VPDRSTRLAILASGAGSTLQAVLDACADDTFGVTVVAVGSDRPGTGALKRAEAAGVETFIVAVEDYPTRLEWDRALTECVAGYRPDMVLSAGFLKLVGPQFLACFDGRFLNSHPALLPAFPGMHAARDALGYGVKIAGCTLFVVDAGIDSGPIVAQAAVPVRDDDDEQSLHERIKEAERAVLVDYLGRMAREGWTVSGRRVTIP